MKNAYSILGISQDATKSDIVKGQVRAMKEKKYSPREIAIAQKQLASPSQRLGVDFVYPYIKDISAKPLKSKIKSISMDINDIDANIFNSLK